MNISTSHTFKILATALVFAPLVNMLMCRVLKDFRSLGTNNSISWLEKNYRFLLVLDKDTLTFMKSRTFSYPLFELVFVTLVLGNYLTHSNSIPYFLRSVTYLVFALPLIFICVKSSMVPDIITYWGTAVALLSSIIPGSWYPALSPVNGFSNSILGACVGYGVFWMLYYLGKLLNRYSPPLGPGNLKAAMMVGAFCGFTGVFLALIYGIMLGGTFALLLLFSGRVNRNTPLPYAQYPAIGGVIIMLFEVYFLTPFLSS